jgi:acyl-CoA synthetase (NDP forming)
MGKPKSQKQKQTISTDSLNLLKQTQIKQRNETQSLQKKVIQLTEVNSKLVAKISVFEKQNEIMANQLKEVCTIQQSIAQQIVIFAETISDIKSELGYDVAQYSFFNADDPWN